MGRADLRNRIHWWDTVGWRLSHSARLFRCVLPHSGNGYMYQKPTSIAARCCIIQERCESSRAQRTYSLRSHCGGYAAAMWRRDETGETGAVKPARQNYSERTVALCCLLESGD